MICKVLVLRAAGTNCDMETAYAFELAGAKSELVHVNRLKERERRLKNYHILAIPGGFTYGDDIASGKILANELRHALLNEIKDFIADGKLVIGICNGFQVLVKAGFLPDFSKDAAQIDATLSLNDSAKFEDRWCYLKRSKSKCIFTKNMPGIIYLPIAHAEGKFIPKNKKILSRLRKNGQVVFRYLENPNGSVDDIAGICDTTGRILGMMPHPERHIELMQHPRWTEKKFRGADGLAIFKNAVLYCKKSLT